MARKITLWYGIINKILAVASIVLSFSVIIATVYTLSKVNAHSSSRLVNVTDTELMDAEHFGMKIETMSRKYISIVNICAGIAFCCAFIQCIASFNTILSCSKKFGIGMKIFIFIHGLAFVLYLVAIIIPFVYYDGKINMKGLLNKEDITNFMKAYFVTLILNDLFLLTFILIICVCHRWGKVEDGSEEQKQKLLGDEKYEY